MIVQRAYFLQKVKRDDNLFHSLNPQNIK